jgi:PAS domain S-box-containing protein
VVGATYPARSQARVRELAPTLPLLIPGVGAQGGDAEATVRAGWRRPTLADRAAPRDHCRSARTRAQRGVAPLLAAGHHVDGAGRTDHHGPAGRADLGCWFGGVGVNTAGMGLLALLVCLASAAAGLRVALYMGSAVVLGIVCLAVAEHLGLIAGANIVPTLPLLRRAVVPLLTVAGGLIGGVMLSSIVERALQDAARRERRFVELVGIAADAYWECDAQLCVTDLWCRESAESETFRPMPVAQLVPWEQPGLHMADAARAAYRDAMMAHRPFRNVLLTWHLPDGSIRHDLVSGTPRYTPGGIFRGYWGVARYVDEEVRAREAMAASEARYRNLFTGLPAALVLHRQGDIIDANPAAAALFGFDSVTAMRGHSVFEVYGGDSHARGRSRLEALSKMPLGTVLPLAQFLIDTLDGRHLTVHATTALIEADDGPAMLSFYLDDTERVSAIEAMQRSQALLSQVIAMSPDGITLTDLSTGRYVMVSDSFERITGHRVADVLGHTSAELGIWRHAADRARLVALLDQHGTVESLPFEFVRRDGSVVRLLISGARFDQGGQTYLLLITRDTSASERTRLEYQRLLNSAQIGIAVTRERRFLIANPHFEQMFGWPAGELIGQPGGSCGRRTPPMPRCRGTGGAGAGPRRGASSSRPPPATTARRCEPACAPTAIDPEHPADGGTIWTAEDVTRQREAEAALARALRRSRGGQPRQERIPGQHQPRNPHAAERPGGAGPAGARAGPVEPARLQQYLAQITPAPRLLADHHLDILDLSKIEAGRLELESAPFELPALLQSLEQAYRALADTAAWLRGDDRPATATVGARRCAAGAPDPRQLPAQRPEVHPPWRCAAGRRGQLPGDRIRFEVHDTGRRHRWAHAGAAVQALHPGR